MRSILIGGSLLAALFVPSTALPCSQALGIFGAAPAEGLSMPANGQLLVAVSPSSDFIVGAQLDTGTNQMPIPLSTRPFGPYHAVIELPTLFGPGTIQATIDGGGGTPQWTYEIREVASEDNVPPSDPSNFTMEADWEANDICFGSGLRVTGTFTPGADERGVAAHVFFVVLPNDGHEIIGTQLEPEMASDDTREFHLFLPMRTEPVDGTTYCVNLAAIDRAHNWSSPRGPVACVTFGDTSPPPPMDAGVIDSGSVDPRDGGVAVRDAGVVGPLPPLGLDEAEPGCGCETAGAKTAGFSWPAFVLLGVALLLRRRLSRPANGR